MSFNTNWNIEKYRAEYESDEHWNLKAKFIRAHKERFAEEELICLAQVFFNIEFMGCRYPTETMILVAELSKDVAHEFRESRKNRLKRTFVTASDAIEAKYKPSKDDVVVPSFTRKQRIEFAKAKCSTAASTSTSIGRKLQHGDIDNEYGGMPKRSKIEPFGDPIRMFYNNNPNIILFQGTEDEPAVNIVQASMDKNKVVTKYETPQTGSTWMLFNGTRMLCGESKVDVSTKILRELQKYFYTIKRKTKFLSRTKIIEKKDQLIGNGKVAAPVEHAKLDSSNLGFKLLQSLGWSGGGLGRTNIGIEEPIQSNIKIGRSGLGDMHSGKLDRGVIRKLLKKYKNTNDLCDLVFSSEFSKEERAIIHSLAKECQLKSSSFGKLEDRQIVISKNSTIQELFVSLRNTTDPLCNEKYEIVPPTQLIS